MSNLKLKDRIASYQEATDYKLLNKVPIIISINGRGFSKLTSLIDKPYCQSFSECMFSTTLKLCNEIEGVLFAYQYNDEICLVVRNDQTNETLPWFDNKLQKLCSISSSISSVHFNNCVNSIKLNLLGDAVFTSQVFVVPNIMEAINTMIYKQQHNFHIAIQSACFYEFLKKYNKSTIDSMLNGLSIDDKISILYQECNVDFNNYPASFKRGIACYKTPQITNDMLKNKWAINTDLPIFTKDQSFLSNVMRMGADIYRG